MVFEEEKFLKRRNMGYKKLKLLKEYLGLPMDPRPEFAYKRTLAKDKDILVKALEELRGFGPPAKALKIIDRALNSIK